MYAREQEALPATLQLVAANQQYLLKEMAMAWRQNATACLASLTSHKPPKDDHEAGQPHRGQHPTGVPGAAQDRNSNDKT
jgi:hypothetical protein